MNHLRASFRSCRPLLVAAVLLRQPKSSSSFAVSSSSLLHRSCRRRAFTAASAAAASQFSYSVDTAMSPPWKYDLTLNVDKELLESSLTNGSPLLGSIDQGTSSTRFLLYTKEARIAASAQVEHTQYFPTDHGHTGWHEHDPLEIYASTVRCMTAVEQAVQETTTVSNTDADALKKLTAIGITNQRETTIAWNKVTGKPYYNAIVWDDLRTTHIAHAITNKDGDSSKDCLRDKTGLPCASYFSGTKVKWLLDHVEALRNDVETKSDQVCFGTIDSWLLHQLTGTATREDDPWQSVTFNTGGLFATDVSNASRWMFLNLETIQWDPELVDAVCKPHKVPLECLPQIKPSSHVYGKLSPSSSGFQNSKLFPDVPLAGVLGDQQAALFGQTAFEPGQAKNTYGTGLFLMMNTGTKMVPSTHGLLTTVGYQIGEDGPVHYALEGSVSHSGSTIQWLRDQMGIIQSAKESETLAKTTESNDGLYFVPAFAGLFAPYWRDDARACIVGMTAGHHKGHICRAALEATAYQTKDVMDAMEKDSQVHLTELKVDGGGTNNTLLMQFQADMLNVPVVKPLVMETTSMGAALAAGLATGVYNDLDDIRKLWAVSTVFEPKMTEADRNKNMKGWKKAIDRSLDWETDKEDDKEQY